MSSPGQNQVGTFLRDWSPALIIVTVRDVAEKQPFPSLEGDFCTSHRDMTTRVPEPLRPLTCSSQAAVEGQNGSQLNEPDWRQSFQPSHHPNAADNSSYCSHLDGRDFADRLSR